MRVLRRVTRAVFTRLSSGCGGVSHIRACRGGTPPRPPRSCSHTPDTAGEKNVPSPPQASASMHRATTRRVRAVARAAATRPRRPRCAAASAAPRATLCAARARRATGSRLVHNGVSSRLSYRSPGSSSRRLSNGVTNLRRIPSLHNSSNSHRDRSSSRRAHTSLAPCSPARSCSHGSSSRGTRVMMCHIRISSLNNGE